MTRRAFVAAAAMLPAAARSRMGIATTCYMTFRRFKDTLEFLEHANNIGAAGIHTSVDTHETAVISRGQRRGSARGSPPARRTSSP